MYQLKTTKTNNLHTYLMGQISFYFRNTPCSTYVANLLSQPQSHATISDKTIIVNYKNDSFSLTKI